jgi:hypothetical protein
MPKVRWIARKPGGVGPTTGTRHPAQSHRYPLEPRKESSMPRLRWSPRDRFATPESGWRLPDLLRRMGTAIALLAMLIVEAAPRARY